MSHPRDSKKEKRKPKKDRPKAGQAQTTAAATPAAQVQKVFEHPDRRSK